MPFSILHNMIKWHVKAYIVIRYVHKLVTLFEKGHTRKLVAENIVSKWAINQVNQTAQHCITSISFNLFKRKKIVGNTECIQRYLNTTVDCSAHFLAKLPFKRLIERFPEAGQIPRRNRTKAMAEKSCLRLPGSTNFFPPCFKTTKPLPLHLLDLDWATQNLKYKLTANLSLMFCWTRHVNIKNFVSNYKTRTWQIIGLIHLYFC